jgi:hypothetical protein
VFKSILVLESPWDDTSVESASVWPLVKEFARARNIRAHHQTFLDKSSFLHWVKVFNDEKLSDPKLLYVAAHGNNARISGLQKSINKSTITTALSNAPNIDFVHFGSCLYGSEKNLTALLTAASHLKWAAGYDKQVDWVDSTLFDILLWGRIESRDDPSKGKKTHTLATELIGEVSGLAKNLGFRFQYRYGQQIKSITAA